MNHAKNLMSTIENLINTKIKKHIVSGILFSTSVFLGGLALTVMLIKIEEGVNEQVIV